MERLKPPAAFNFNGENLLRAWKAWKNLFKFYMVATESDKKANQVKTAILLSSIGDQGREIFKTFTLADANIYLDVVKEFEDYCIPKKTPPY